MSGRPRAAMCRCGCGYWEIWHGRNVVGIALTQQEAMEYAPGIDRVTALARRYGVAA